MSASKLNCEHRKEWKKTAEEISERKWKILF